MIHILSASLEGFKQKLNETDEAAHKHKQNYEIHHQINWVWWAVIQHLIEGRIYEYLPGEGGCSFGNYKNVNEQT